MYITYYTSNRFISTVTIEATMILGTLDENEMTDADRVALQNDEVITMCNAITKRGTIISIPWKFITEICHGVELKKADQDKQGRNKNDL